jgi:hypothetical protein
MGALQDWHERARSVPIQEVIARRGIRLAGGNERRGPCPVCGGTDRFSINTTKQVFNCRGCQRGGSVIDLVMTLDGISFENACETLAGPPPRQGEARTGISKSPGTAAPKSKGAAWVYLDADGRPYLKVHRYVKPDGTKSYPQSHWDSAQWVSGQAEGSEDSISTARTPRQ